MAFGLTLFEKIHAHSIFHAVHSMTLVVGDSATSSVIALHFIRVLQRLYALLAASLT
jgi:hypothetical protein